MLSQSLRICSLFKLYLKSLKHGGRLQLDESIPYTPQMIATITRQQIGTVERAIKIFLQLGLMEQMADGAFYMSNIELLIGQSSTEGERKRRARQANRLALNDGGQMSAHCPDIRPPEIEIEIELERELEKGRPTPARLGRYQNVFLSEAEQTELQTDFPAVWQEYVERLSEYMASTGKTYKSHAATVRRWIADDRRKSKGSIADYSCKEGESL